ncbi:MAG: ketopantoate reductase family protein [Clostridia bacterium]|nr:ketopantoate reductase family protein [Clostridia bacterium]
MTEYRTLIIGCGAIGGTLCALLCRGGYKVDLLEIAPGAAEKINSEGLKLTGAAGNVTARVNAIGSYDELDGQYDIVILCVKYLALTAAAKSILPYLKEDSVVMGMQNGICTQELASVVGEKRTAGCMIGFGATKLSANEVEMTSGGEMYVGMADDTVNEKLNALCAMYNSVVPTKVTTELLRRQFSKLIINCCINATAAITGKTLGVLLDDERAQRLFLSIAREGMYVARAMGVNVPKYGLLLDYRFLMLSDAEIYNRLCSLVVKLVGKTKYADVKPSTLQSLLNGEKTEVDIFNGYLAKKAEEYGVDAPVNTKLTEMIRDIERGEREMGMDNLAEFYPQK